MKQTVNNHAFIDAFRQAGRADQFSYEGLSALFDYLEELEQDTGEDWELDVIALCCEFTEYISVDKALEEYKHTVDDLDDLRDYTQVIEITGTNRLIIQDF